MTAPGFQELPMSFFFFALAPTLAASNSVFKRRHSHGIDIPGKWIFALVEVTVLGARNRRRPSRPERSDSPAIA